MFLWLTREIVCLVLIGAGWHANRPASHAAVKQTNKEISKQTNKQISKYANKQICKQTSEQANQQEREQSLSSWK